MVNRRERGRKNGSSITRVKRFAMREIQGGSVNNRFIRCALSRRRKNFFRPLKREFASLFLPSQRRRFNYCSASWKSSVCFLSRCLRKARFYSSVSPCSSSPVYPSLLLSRFQRANRVSSLHDSTILDLKTNTRGRKNRATWGYEGKVHRV